MLRSLLDTSITPPNKPIYVSVPMVMRQVMHILISVFPHKHAFQPNSNFKGLPHATKHVLLHVGHTILLTDGLHLWRNTLILKHAHIRPPIVAREKISHAKKKGDDIQKYQCKGDLPLIAPPLHLLHGGNR